MSDTHQNNDAPQELAYFASRAEAERQRAAEAADERARLAHERLAEEYRARAKKGPANDTE